ncbi:uncharacterized protein LOC135837929 [Planococcus citri]|uniref:uncharacterized protein LOC135837929 n=1 Tax=Planococcus citri TaxID=170843 RepID=UPI0031F9DEA5
MKMDRNPIELRSLAAESSCIQLVYEWASCQMSAIYTWKNNEEGYGTCPDHDWLIGQMNEMQIPGSPVMPDSVRDQIEDEFTWILKQVTDWICYHHKKNFFHDEPASSLKEYLLKLIWKPDRSGLSIDYVATAKNVLAGSNFNTMEKYRFACTYCFPEDVRKLKDMAKIARNWCFEREPLLVYWSKYLTKQLHTMNFPDYVPIEVVMFREAVKKYDLQAPVEYFFTKLNTTGLKIWQCCDVITNPKSKGRKYLKELLLSLMNEREKDLVYQDNMIEIINTFLEQRNFESIGQMYSELKGKLNSTNYASIIEVLAKNSIRYGRNFNSLSSLLMEIWNDAIGKDGFLENVRDLQSRIAIEYSIKISSPENRLNYCYVRDEFHRPLEFIRTLASAYDARNFLKSNFHWLVIWQPFASIVQLIDEFQLDAEDVEELKRHTRHPYRMRRICLKYLQSGKLDEFSALVSFCYQGHDAIITAYQEDLLMDEDGLKALAHGLNFRVDWRIVHKFVNNVFRNMEGFASVYTARLLFHVFENTTEYFLREMMEQGEANTIVECIQTLVPDNVNLSLAKQTFVDSYLKTLHNDSYFVFKQATFNDMLIWCYGTDAGPAQFKEMINVSEVFVAQLEGCVVMSEPTFKISDSMEEFLHWYYPIESERRAFKLEMIHSNDVFETIEMHLAERRYRRRMLNWFFENDADKITEFIAKIFH